MLPTDVLLIQQKRSCTPNFMAGDTVMMRNTATGHYDIPATVTAARQDNPLSYHLLGENGKEYIRGHRLLRKSSLLQNPPQGQQLLEEVDNQVAPRLPEEPPVAHGPKPRRSNRTSRKPSYYSA